MKILCTLLCLAVFVPAWAEEAAPVDEPVVSIHAASPAEIARQAVWLGYQNFYLRFSAFRAMEPDRPKMTSVDFEILTLIRTGFQPLFAEAERLDQANELESTADGELILTLELNNRYQTLLAKLTDLLFQNQQRYDAWAFFDKRVALEETHAIVQGPIRNGGF